MAREIWKPGNMLYPLPVVLISTIDPETGPNLFTVAWAGTVCTNPALVSISVRPERHSYRALKENGEFVINLTTRELAFATDYCGVKSGRDTDKWKDMHLTQVPSSSVAPPGIAESPVCIECRVKEILPLGSHDLFLAEVAAVSVDEQYKDEKGKFCLEKAEPIVYSHGQYLTCGEVIGSFGYSVRKK